jgi:putative ABC transport system permease protein
MFDGLQEILFTLRQNKLRTLLTAFGVFWGVFVLILLLGFGRGVQHGVMEDFGSEVLDFIVVFPGDTSVAYHGMGLGRRIQLDQSDVQAVTRQIRGIRLVAAENSLGNGTITYQNRHSNADIRGIPDEYFQIKEGIPFNFGRRLDSLDVAEIRKIAVIGATVAERLFPKGMNPVGKDIRVKDVVMKIAGVFYDRGNQGRNSDRVFIPQSTYRRVFGGGDRIDAIWLRPETGADGFELEKKVIELTKRRHSVAPDDKRGINSFNMAGPARNINGLFIGINVFIWFVGLGTLTAGIVGISNIMIITVRERTREIGIRKALGATPFAIVSPLLLESMLVTGISGYLGLVLGVGLLKPISLGLRTAGAKLPYFLNPEVNFQIAITAMLLLIGAGILAGLAPALRAAKITPTEAMGAS